MSRFLPTVIFLLLLSSCASRPALLSPGSIQEGGGPQPRETSADAAPQLWETPDAPPLSEEALDAALQPEEPLDVSIPAEGAPELSQTEEVPEAPPLPQELPAPSPQEWEAAPEAPPEPLAAWELPTESWEEAQTAPYTPEPEPSQEDPVEQPSPQKPPADAAPPSPPEDSQEQGEPPAGSYDFTQPAPEGPAVSRDYFQDAAFVGDSRTEGMLIYSGLGTTNAYTSNGLSIFRLSAVKMKSASGEQVPMLEALAERSYKKVYLSLGINELGYHNDKGFYRSYCQAIDALRESQPGAIIYVQGLIPVNEPLAREKTGKDYFTNEHIRAYNELIRQAAQEKQAIFLDLYPDFAQEDGSLPPEASGDGIHLKGTWCKQWLAYLQSHTVEETLLQSPEAAATEEEREHEAQT